MLTLTIDKLIERIRDEQLYFVDLFYYVDSYRSRKQYAGSAPESPNPDDIINWVKKTTESGKEIVWHALLRTKKTANGEKGTIALDFSFNPQPVEQTNLNGYPPPAAPATQIHGLGMIEGFINSRQTELSAKTSSLDNWERELRGREREADFNKTQNLVERSALERERKAFEEEKAAHIREIEALKALYNSRKEAATEGFTDWLIKLNKLVTVSDNGKLAIAPAAGIQGVQNPPAEAVTYSPEDNAIMEFGEAMATMGLSVAQLKALFGVTIEAAKHLQAYPTDAVNLPAAGRAMLDSLVTTNTVADVTE